MVSILRVEFPGCVALLLLLLLCPTAFGAPGDCDNNGTINTDDALFIINYLHSGGPPPVKYTDCDCDGFLGVNDGDALQIMAYITAGASLYAWPGSDLIAPANTSVMISGKVDGATLTKTFIFMNNPTIIRGMLTLPFSFSADPGEADLNCANITIGPMFPTVGVEIDNTTKTFRLDGGTIVATTNWEVLCEIDFVTDPLGSPGMAHRVEPAPSGKFFPLLIAKKAYDGTNFERMLFPRFVPDAFGSVGDANCDGAVNIRDAVYLIAYIFNGGPKPGDPDGDGTPECP
jgi:hypothetical protein